MGKKLLFFVFLICSLTVKLNAQQNVSISDVNTLPDASSVLDVSSTTKGLLVPRVALTSTTNQSPIPNGTTVATALLVYNTATSGDVTPGFYHWANNKWNRFDTGNNIGDWKLLGNAGTNAGTNFLGTTDAADLVFRTNNTERIRTLGSNGKVGIGTSSPTMRLDVTDASTTTDDATIRGTATGGARTYGVFGITTSVTTNASGVRGEANGAAVVNGVWGLTSSTNGGSGVYGLVNTTAGNSNGVLGIAQSSAGVGMYGLNLNTTGTGLLVAGNNSPAYTLATSGSGAAFNGIPIGSVSYGNNAANGWGICSAGNDGIISTIAGGGGGSFTGNQWGIFSVATLISPNATDRSTFVGNYNSNASTPATVYVGARIGGTHYKILGTAAGSVSTTMTTKSGERILFAPEAPENWFFDLGEIQLINGKAIVHIDPIFIDCISDSIPFKVFVQGAEDTFGSIRVKRNQKEKTFELEDLGGPSMGIVQYSIYGIWRTKENLRFPEFTPEMHQKTIETPKLINNQINKH